MEKNRKKMKKIGKNWKKLEKIGKKWEKILRKKRDHKYFLFYYNIND